MLSSVISVVVYSFINMMSILGHALLVRRFLSGFCHNACKCVSLQLLNILDILVVSMENNIIYTS